MLKRISQLIVVLSLCVLSGCSGFKPLYGTAPGGGSVAVDMSSLTVEEQHTRGGQIIRNELLDGVQPGLARYSLKLDVTERWIDVASLSSSLGSRRRYALTAHYELIDLASSKSLTKGDSFSNVEFDTVNVPVSDLQAADDARLRAGKELGGDLRLRIATFLSASKG
jgi:LPS-assembly lipoprotein